MSLARSVAFAAVAVVLGSGCVCGPAPCAKSTDCGGASVCLAQISVCAPRCASDSQCQSNEKCSTGGGCVAKNGCGVDGDCKSGLLCGELASCIPPCTPTSCPSGQMCGATGHCVSANSDGGSSCGGQLFGATRVDANILVVLDHSGSMMEVVGGSPKWTAAVGAVNTVVSQNQSIQFGLQVFSLASNQCNPGSVVVPVGPNNATAISQALPSQADGKGTPIGAALGVAAGSGQLDDPNRAEYVLLITDGMENCGGDPVSQVQSLFNRGVKTYVVGFGADVDPTRLTNMAISGGTARQTTPRYYQADAPAELQAALNAIAQGALGCDFKLNGNPPDANKIYVYVNGTLAPRDPNKVNGWEYNATTGRITLYGPACDAVSKHPEAKVSVVYGCPDPTIVETCPTGSCPTDGGSIDFDAGILN